MPICLGAHYLDIPSYTNLHLATKQQAHGELWLARLMESLKSDLKNVQCVIKDLLSQLSGELPIASWRFPEKLAASLDPLEELQSREEGLGGFKTLLMELLVDRYVRAFLKNTKRIDLFIADFYFCFNVVFDSRR